MLKELKEGVKKVKKIMYEQNKNINKEIENLKGTDKEILQLKNIINQIKNSLEGFKWRFEQAEEIISKPEDKKLPDLRNRKKKDWRTMNRDQWSYGTPSRRPSYTLWESQKENKERKGERNISWNNGWKLPKFDKR